MRNINLANEKGLIVDNDEQRYNELVKKYKYLLEYYINTQIDLKKYEEMIQNSGLYIGINTKYKSLNNYLNLDYIFFINNLFVEKLSIGDIKILESFDNVNITDELIDIVIKTYQDVIHDNYLKDEYTDKLYKVCYGPVVPFNMVDNNALVFKIYYGKNLIDLADDAFIELHEKQLSFFDELREKVINEVKEKLNIGCAILLEKDIY